jgi:uncharacterized protein YndB with AHSA1/START domain
MIMIATTVESTVQTLDIWKEETIAAPLELVFEAILEQLGPLNATGPNSPLPMKFEPWPGGRWYRDLSDNSGHFWGHVQVIKPPTLLEICGPLCMSYPAWNHVQYRLTAENDLTRLTFWHRAIGQILPEHRDGMPDGWAHELSTIRKLAESRVSVLDDTP